MSPGKPTSDDATSTARPQEMYEKGSVEARAAEAAEGGAKAHPAGLGRKEIGGKAQSGVHPPHVTVNDEDAPLQDDKDHGGDVAVLPANASGSEKKGSVGTLNPGSSYEGRREEDKDQPPSDTGG